MLHEAGLMRAPRIAIIGGGIGGLAAALALGRRGAEVIVCEQSPGTGEIGAGLHLSPNALKALRVLPYLGQGAAMAIEDACVLAAAIARYPDDLDAALLVYERLRVPRAQAAVLGSRARARENHLVSSWARLKRDVKFALRQRFGRDKTAFQSAWLYSYDVGRELEHAP
jgi:2-polyprenyl-6-methoxyphenol hydroxylase-like FAD-dependent oxidoreductase